MALNRTFTVADPAGADEGTDLSSIISRLEALEADAPKVGDLKLWTREEDPDEDSNWMINTGQALPKVAYPELYAAIGDTYNDGTEGAGNFRLPPTPGRAIIGAGAGSGLTSRELGDLVGEETHLLTDDEMPSHSHSISPNGHRHPVLEGITTGDDSTHVDSGDPASGSWLTGLTALTIGSAGSDVAHNNMQPSLALKYAIKYR